MPGRVFVTGASGFVGSVVVEELLSRGYGVNALVNRRELHESSTNVRAIKGSLFDAAAIADGMRNANAVIHLVGIIMEKPSKGITFERIHFEGTKVIVDAAAHSGVKRYVHMSALGSRPNAVSRYHQSKFLAEQYVRASGLDWTIFRPSLIHGPKGEFMQMEAKWARGAAPPFVAMPYFGGKKAGRLQPVYVNDVARALVDALEKPQTISEIYPLGGADVLSWPELHRTCAETIVGHRRWVVSMPVWLAKFATCVTPPALLPFNRDQVIMSQEDNTADLAKFKADFGWEPAHFAPTLREYASKL